MIAIGIVIAYAIAIAIVSFMNLRINRAGQIETADTALPWVDPYREPAPAPKEHELGCKGCDWIDRYGRWQPPEVVIAAGLPVECLMLKYEKTLDEIDEWAKSYGLVRVQYGRRQRGESQ